MPVINYTNPSTVNVALETQWRRPGESVSINAANRAVRRYLQLRSNPQISWNILIEAVKEERLGTEIFRGVAEAAGLSTKCNPQFVMLDSKSHNQIGIIFVDEKKETKLTMVPISKKGIGIPRSPNSLESQLAKEALKGIYK